MTANEIYLGDAYELIKQVPDNSVDCVYTDIPYLYVSGGAGKSKLSKRIQKTKESMLENNIYNGVNYTILDDIIRVSKKVNVFIWVSKLQVYPVLKYFVEKGYSYNILTWNKTNPTPATNNSWLPDIEYCLVFREAGLGLNNGYHLKSKWFTSPINKTDKDNYLHPTIKPLELVKRHIEHATQLGDVILDPFLGSGTTAVASKELGRQYIGFEIDEEFYDIAKNRLNGIKADGQTSIFTDFNLLRGELDE